MEKLVTLVTRSPTPRMSGTAEWLRLRAPPPRHRGAHAVGTLAPTGTSRVSGASQFVPRVRPSAASSKCLPLGRSGGGSVPVSRPLHPVAGHPILQRKIKRWPGTAAYLFLADGRVRYGRISDLGSLTGGLRGNPPTHGSRRTCHHRCRLNRRPRCSATREQLRGR